MRLFLVTALGVAALVMTGDAAAGTRSARLVYLRGQGAEACADEDGMRNAVMRRLGFDPFVAYADVTIVVELRKEKGVYAADVRIVDRDGIVEGTRSLHAAKCNEVVEALSLTLSIVVDPASAFRPSPPPESTPMTPPPDPAPPLAPSPVAPEPRVAIERVTSPASSAGETPPPLFVPAIYLAPIAVAGAEITFDGGALLGVDVASRRLRFALEARADLPVSKTTAAEGNAAVRTHLASGRAIACARLQRVDACALLEAGAIFASSRDVSGPRADAGTYVAAGLRLGATLLEEGRAYVRVFADGLAQTRTRYEINGVDAAHASPWALDFGAAVGWRFR